MPYRTIRSTGKIVEHILRDSPAARMSDKRLLVEFWLTSGMGLTQQQIELFADLPSPEAITRARRKFQERGEYLPPEQIHQERHERAEQVKQEMIYG